MADALKWPIIGWITVDVLFILVLFVDGVDALMTPATLAPLALGFGIWAGYKTVEFGGGFGGAIGAGVIVGAVCGLLTLLLGVVHGMSVFPLAVFNLALNIAGAVVGGGFLLTRTSSSGSGTSF